MDPNGELQSQGLRRPNRGGNKADLDPVDVLSQETRDLSISNNNDKTKAETNAILASTNLNVAAREFVPQRNLTQSTIPVVSDPNPGVSYYTNGSGDHHHHQWNANQASYHDDVKDGEVELDDYFALSELKEFIDQVSSMPHLYDSNIDNLTDVLNSCIDEDEDIVLQCIVNNIVDQAILDSNFRYSGVRLCEHLISNLNIRKAKGNFKEELMSRCQREHMRRNTLVKSSDGSYLRGVTLVIADLYTRLHEQQLIDSIPDLVETLLNNPSPDNVKTSCQVLKLCGPSLEAKSVKFQSIIEKLKEVEGMTKVDSTKEIIKSVLEYRDRGWKSAPLPADFYNPYAEGNIPPEDPYAGMYEGEQYPYYPNEGYGMEAVDPNAYFNGAAGYDFGNDGDEQNVDVIDAFEEFLKASGQTK